MSRPRAYRRPISIEETAARIVHSIRAHAEEGVSRVPEQYTSRPEVLRLVAWFLANEKKETPLE